MKISIKELKPGQEIEYTSFDVLNPSKAKDRERFIPLQGTVKAVSAGAVLYDLWIVELMGGILLYYHSGDKQVQVVVQKSFVKQFVKQPEKASRWNHVSID